MRRVTRPLLVLHQDAALRERIRRAAPHRTEYRAVQSWEELRVTVRTAPPAALLVVDPYHRGNGELASELRSLLWDYPSATVLAALEVRPGRYGDLRTLGAWGVVDVLVLDEEDTLEALARRLRGAQGRRLQGLLTRSLPPGTSGHARSILLAAAEVAAGGGQARELARALYLAPRTLLRWCNRADLPPPRRLLAWMRVLMACELLDDPGRTVFSVAHACGYASDNSLRRALQDFLGTTPTQLRSEGAFARAAEAFLNELKETRAVR